VFIAPHWLHIRIPPVEVTQHAIVDKRNETLLVQLTLTSTIEASEPDTCAVSDSPSNYNHQLVTLKGMVISVNKRTSRTGREEMTFLLTSPAGYGHRRAIVYFQVFATVSNGDRVQVDRAFETHLYIQQRIAGHDITLLL
jgi:hypothetical protein